jgi:hypothetical protein
VADGDRKWGGLDGFNHGGERWRVRGGVPGMGPAAERSGSEDGGSGTSFQASYFGFGFASAARTCSAPGSDTLR